MHNIEKWLNILLKSCVVSMPRFLKYVWPFFNIKPERVNRLFELLLKRFTNFVLINITDQIIEEVRVHTTFI